MNTYHIHITSDKPVESFKKTEIVLEMGSRIEEDTMWTKTVTLSGSVEDDVKLLRDRYEFPQYKRFKIELLNQSQTIPSYSKDRYRELHIKLLIQNKNFLANKVFLQAHSYMYGYTLSNNPKERDADITTQFLNMRYTTGTYETSQGMLTAITNFLRRRNFSIKEIKDEVSVYDSNFSEDSWWAH